MIFMQDFFHTLITYWESLSDPVKEIISFVFTTIIYLLALIIVLNIVRALIDRYGTKLMPTTKSSLKTLSRMFILLIFGVAYLNQFESFSGSLIGLTALLGTAIGFASTQTIGNMISGIYIMISRPFYITDYVMFPKLKIEGIVADITINYTKIILANGTNAIIANKTVLNTEVINTRVEITTDESTSIDTKETQEVKDNLKSNLKSIFKKLSDNKAVYYIYPIKFSIDVNMKQKIINKAIAKLENYLEAVDGVKDMSWNIVGRSRLEISYEATILVEKPASIFNLVSKTLNQLELFIEEENQ